MKSILFTWLLFFPFVLLSQDEVVELYSTTRGEVVFVSEAPLELIKASSADLRGLIDPAKRTFAFTIPNNSFRGFNSPLQEEHFYENYIEAEKYPASTFEGKIIEDINFSIPGSHLIRVKGMLSIHGVEQERVIKVDLEIINNKIIANALFNLELSDHNITIPKMVYQKIAETISVNVKLELVPKE